MQREKNGTGRGNLGGLTFSTEKVSGRPKWFATLQRQMDSAPLHTFAMARCLDFLCFAPFSLRFNVPPSATSDKVQSVTFAGIGQGSAFFLSESH